MQEGRGRVSGPVDSWRGFPALLGGGLAARALGLLKLLVFAPLLGPAGFGALRLATTASQIIFPLASLGLHTSPLRYLPEYENSAIRRAFVWRVLLASLTGCTLVAGVLAFFLPQIGRMVFSENAPAPLVGLLLLGIPVMMIYNLGNSVSRGLGRFGVSAAAETVQNVTHLGLALLFVWTIGSSPTLVFGAGLMALLGVGIYLLASSFRSIPIKRWDAHAIPAGLTGRTIRYSLWYGLIPAFAHLFDFMDRWAIAQFHGLELAGAYSLIPLVAGGMTILALSLGPVLTRQGAIDRRKALSDGYGFVWSGIGLVALGSLLYGLVIRLLEPILWQLVDEAWRSAALTVPWFLVYFTWFNLYYLLGAIATVEEATWVHLLALVVGGGINIALNLLLVPAMAALGAVIASTLAMAAALGVHLVYTLCRRIRVPSRFVMAFALPLILLLPVWIAAPILLLLIMLGWNRSILVDGPAKEYVHQQMARLSLVWRPQ